VTGTSALDPFLWRRRWRTAPGRQHQLRQPVVSVGNLAAGGRGKTPVVEHLARLLVEAGERPAILSRGYGRSVAPPGAVVVSDGHGLRVGPDLSGDEPGMLAQALPGAIVVVCEDRRIAGTLAEGRLGATVHVLDDGFQHLELARDVDLVLVTPEDLSGRAFPLGRLRETPRALAAADAVLVDGDLGDRAWPFAGVERFGMRRSLGAPAVEGRPLSPEVGPVVALAGIARPERLARDLTALGWTVAESVTFADHHRYTVRDLTNVASVVRRTGAAAVVTTAKDAVRLRGAAALPVPLAVAVLRASVEPSAAFRSWLSRRIADARS